MKINTKNSAHVRAVRLLEAIKSAEQTAKRLALADCQAGDDVFEKFNKFQEALQADFRFVMTQIQDSLKQ